MNREQQLFNWQSAFSAIALAVAAWGSSPAAEALPTTKLGSGDFKVAQVGVRSQINAPTPLNLRPSTHIPLPTNSRSSDYYSRPGHSPQYRRHRRHDKYDHGHHHRSDRHRGHHRRRHRRGGTVIIINPASSSSYNHSGSYIRIISK